MTENTMHTDLLAAQREMPVLQKSAINPHFGNRFVPLDELIPAVLPILNKHNLVLLQQPTVQDGKPALRTVLMHSSGEVLESTMLLQATKDDPQQQGSAITYARRYSLLSWLGLVADVDDDAETHRTNGQQPAPRAVTPASRPTRPAPAGDIPHPNCPEHNVRCKLIPAGTSAAGKAYSSFFSCPQKGCGQNGKSWTVFADKWSTDWMMEHNNEPAQTDEEAFAALPFE